jgi:hypothetical protein
MTTRDLTEARTSLRSLKQYGLISLTLNELSTIPSIELTKANLSPQKLDFNVNNGAYRYERVTER